MGRRTTRTAAGADDALVYDNWGRLSHHRNPLAPSGQEFTYGYALVSTNQTGRLLSIAAPVPGLTTALSYLENAGNHRLQEIWNKKGTDTLSKFNYQFDSAGRIRKWLQQVASGTPQALTNYYDREGQLLDQVIAPQDGAPAKGYSYAYDAAGNRTAEQIDTLDNTWSSIVSSATYNDLNQLTGISGSGTLPVRFAGWIDEPGTVTVTSSGTTVPAQMTWDEDGPSGRTRFSATLTLASGTQDATITATDRNNPGNQQAQNYTVQVAGGAAKSFTYDANGNCESMTVAGVTTTYAWDAEDRLVQITKGNQTTKIAYDAFSRWRTIIEKTGAVTNSTKHFLWSGLTLVAESDANNQVTRRFYPEGMQVITGSQTSSYYFTRDHLGSIREVTDSSGAVVARYDYDPYGRRTQISGETDFEFGFTGHYYHAQSGLHLAPFRAYSADLGRWLSRDPIGEAGGLNLYGYVGNSLIDHVDRFGLYGYAAKFWADLSVNGSWWQKAVAWPLGILAAAVPDAVGVSVNGNRGFVGGGTVGLQKVRFGRGDTADYSCFGYTKGPHGKPNGGMTPQLGVGINFSLGWSSEYLPGPDSWTGRFSEASMYEGPLSVGSFWGGSWQGLSIGAGVGPVPGGASYFDTVDYQLLGQ
jgi:RHS repeat-associated protein